MKARTQYNNSNSKVRTEKILFANYEMMIMRNDVTTSRVICIHKILHFPYDVRLHGFLLTGINVYNSVSGVLCTCTYARRVQFINRTTGQHSAP